MSKVQKGETKMRAHISVKPLERDEVSVAAVRLLVWKQWEQGIETTGQGAPHLLLESPSVSRAYLGGLCCVISLGCLFGKLSPIHRDGMARPCWSQRTGKWPGLGHVYDGRVGEADLRSVSKVQEAGEQGTGVCVMIRQGCREVAAKNSSEAFWAQPAEPGRSV